MKTCSKCKQSQPEENFSWANKSKGLLCRRCKSCVNEYYWKDGKQRQRQPYKGTDYSKDYFKRGEDGLHHVYILPEENYAGTTKNPTQRERLHRSSKHRNTKGFRVIYSTPNRQEALELEELLHDTGYEGKHINNQYY
jgi:predicted GIY-YIG superfamily endonuclease